MRIIIKIIKIFKNNYLKRRSKDINKVLKKIKIKENLNINMIKIKFNMNFQK